MSATGDARFHLRLLAASVLLVGLAFTQDPGFLVADTKFDLVAAPGDLLGRALHLWDGEGALGQLQNQAYGYLWPMGSFFAGGALLSLPGWVVQRLWWGLTLALALTGTAKVSRALGVRSDLACLLAGAAYALSPRMLTTLGPISSESWPMALAPWVLLPLVVGAERGSPRRAGALAGLGVAMVGGVNAAATFAVVPLGVVWLLTRSPGPRRRSLMVWWTVATVLGSLWWLVPLLLMGAYSPPFLDYIETASVTTFPTDLFDVLRGTSNWVPYVDPTSRAGRDLLTTPYLALDAGVLLFLGLVGLMSSRTPHRSFLARSLLLGLLLVGLGHTGAVQGLGAATLHDLLDGVLSPVRNVHKFDLVVRLPLVVGLGLLVDRLLAGRREAGWRAGVQRSVLLATAVVVVAAGSVPALVGRIAPAQAVLSVPDYWGETTRWLAERDAEEGDATALLAPGSTFARYQWGSPDDEPMQWLAESRWAVRNVVPLTPPGNIRALDGIEQRLAQGEGSPGLAAALARMGVQYVVVRNDLARDVDVPDPLLVRQALLASPGLAPAAEFGPTLGGEARLAAVDERVVVDGGRQARYRAVEVWEVRDASRAVLTQDVPVVAAGPEDLPDLVDLGVLDRRPVLLAADAPAELPAGLGEGSLVLTDGLRAREHAFARIHDADSPVRAEGDPRNNGNPSRDYLLDSGDRWSTTARLVGAEAVRASSSASDVDTFGPVRPEAHPYAALDGDPATAWRTDPFPEGAAWWEVELDAPRTLTSVTLTGGPGAAENQAVRVLTDAGSSGEVPLGPGTRRRVLLDAGSATGRLRVVAVDADRPLTLAEVEVPGLAVRRVLVLPQLPAAWGPPDAVVLRAIRDARSGCLRAGDLQRGRVEVRCTPRGAVGDEEPAGLDRLVRLAAPASYDEVVLRARPRAGAALDDLVLAGAAVRIAASSSAVDDPRAGAVAAIDGDPGTSWLADVDDATPRLDLSWLSTSAVTGLRVRLDPDTAAAAPLTVRMTWPGGSRVVRLVDGRASFPVVWTASLSLQVLDAESVTDLGFDGVGRPVGVGIGELRLQGVPYEPVRPSLESRRTPCGSGPELTVGATTWATRVVAAPAQLLAGEEVEVLRCGREARTDDEVRLAEGSTEVRLVDASAFEATAVVLGDPPPAAVPTDVPVDEDGAVSRSFAVPEGGGVLVGRENANPGWTATRDGEELSPVVLDGWQQGWVLPDDGSGEVVATFAPDRAYRAGLLLGTLGLVALVGGLLVGARRRGRRAPLRPPALVDRSPGPTVAVGTALAGGALLAGVVGALLAGGLALVVAVLRRRAEDAAPWVLAAPVLGAAAWFALLPWGDPDGWAGSRTWPAYLALAPVLSLMLLGSGDGPAGVRRQGWRPLSRRAGRSTTR